jgi:phage antirepressor YoqD-like protein
MLLNLLESASSIKIREFAKKIEYKEVNLEWGKFAREIDQWS